MCGSLVGRALLALWMMLLPGMLPASGERQDVNIGVLALRGFDKAQQTWEPLAHQLEQRIPGRRFNIVPLGFDDIHLAVRQRRIDFVLANSSFYVELEMLYGVSPVATMRSQVAGGRAVSRFGGVIFTRGDRRDIQSLEDLRGRSLAAVDQASFGGWLTGWRELRHHGIQPQRDLSRLVFLGTHDAVVHAVRERRVDVGIARTGTLEQMASEGLIDLEDFHILGRRQVYDYPFLLSTELYPEWPLAKLPGVPDELAVQVAVALMQTTGTPAGGAGWALPQNYQSVHEALKELKSGPYRYLNEVSWRAVLGQYWHWLVIAVLLLLLSLLVAAYVVRINRRLQLQQNELSSLNSSLEARVAERTSQIQTLLGREHYLRGIVEMVADINQIIITSDSPPQMLKAACDRLIAHSDYRFAWVAMQDQNSGNLEVAARAYASAAHMRVLLDLSAEGIANRAMSCGETLAAAENSAGNWVNAALALPLSPDAFSQPFGVLCVYSVRQQGFDSEEVGMLEQLAGDLGFAVHAFRQQGETQRLQQERISNYEETILSMIDLIEKRDNHTAGHSRRVATYCEQIARRLGLDETRISTLSRAAILHDIGKIVIPDSVLLKPGRLTELEYTLIQQHVVVGYESLSHIEMYRDLAEIMRHHHERLDGSGYPQGLAGEAIPLEARIMAVADSFDAMTSQRIYKPRKSVEEALGELRRLAGQQYDVQVVEAAIEVLHGIDLPLDEGQMPQTPLERQRFAYFFNDQLTGVYNLNYLEYALHSDQPAERRHACLVLLHGFARLNASAGWKEGDRVLREFAEYLAARCPQSQIFRVMGDDFVVLGPEARELVSALVEQAAALQETGLAVELHHLNLATADERERLRALLDLLPEPSTGRTARKTAKTSPQPS